MAQSCRELFGNPTGTLGDSFPEQHPGLISVVWCVVLLLVFIPLSVRKFNRSRG
jgi:cobalamin synthase